MESEGVKSAEAVEEEARAERKRRQRQAQEEFRLKLLKAKDKEDKPEAPRNSSGFDKLLLEIPSQEIMIEQAGSTDEHKRKSPAPEGSCKKRVLNRLDIVQNK